MGFAFAHRRVEASLIVRRLRERNLNEHGEDRPTIAVLGMGKMGQALAGRLLDQGWNIVIWNRSPKDLSQLESRGAFA